MFLLQLQLSLWLQVPLSNDAAFAVISVATVAVVFFPVVAVKNID